MGVLGNFIIPIPENENDQQEIIEYLDEKTGQIDGLIERAKEVIQRLEEYRTAVITAAVTGKIKVDACFQPRCG